MYRNRRSLVLYNVTVLLVIFLISATFNDCCFSYWSYHFFTSLYLSFCSSSQQARNECDDEQISRATTRSFSLFTYALACYCVCTCGNLQGLYLSYRLRVFAVASNLLRGILDFIRVQCQGCSMLRFVLRGTRQTTGQRGLVYLLRRRVR